MKNYNISCLKKLLLRKSIKISVAESCTGGELSSALTSIPGSSGYFVLGIVVYQTEIKERVLGVSHETIKNFSVYSPEVAYEMAKRVKEISGADIGVSTTGEFNGKGYFYYCLFYSSDYHKVGKFEVSGDRKASKTQAVGFLLGEILKFVILQP